MANEHMKDYKVVFITGEGKEYTSYFDETFEVVKAVQRNASSAKVISVTYYETTTSNEIFRVEDGVICSFTSPFGGRVGQDIREKPLISLELYEQ